MTAEADSIKGTIDLWSNTLLNNWFFVWVMKLIRVGSKQNWNDLKLKLRSHESAKINTDLLEKEWNKQKSTYSALKNVFGREYMWIAVYKLSWTFFTWAGAWYLLEKMIEVLGDSPFTESFASSDDEFKAHMYAMALGLAGLFSSIAIHQQYAECNRMGLKVKAAVTGLVYRKSLKLSRVKGGAGQVINILTSDVTKINDAVINFHFLWAAFIEVALIIFLSFYIIGISAFPALGLIILLLPLQMYLGKRTDDLFRGQSEKTTERVHLMSELLTAIKLIKFYAWELPFANKIEEIRLAEVSFIYDGLINKVVNYTVVFAIPVLVALTCLSMYVALGNVLTATVSFTALSVFNTLRYPFFMLPMAVKSAVGAVSAIQHLDEFLKQPEVVPLVSEKCPEGKDLALELEKCDFKWDGSEGGSTLSKISLKIKKGSKVGVVGEVGSGKSSLLAALLGQIRLIKGKKPKVYGSTAYMSQEAWMLNYTLRENILFGTAMDKKRYKEIIRVSGLQRDLTLLVAGDQTEIAERGANLSGGQRQRISLARSIYFDADIVLLDDPLSAVDQHVGRLIFEECFMKHLKDKTVIVAINQLQYLQQLDHIVYVQEGEIYAQGSYSELMSTCERFSTLVNAHVADDDVEEEQDLGAEPMNNEDFDPVTVTVSAPKSANRQPTTLEMMEMNTFSVLSRNQLSVRNVQSINEGTIRSLIELQNTTKITGAERDHDVAKVMLQNELSRFSVIKAPRVPDEGDSINEETDEEAKRRGKLVQDDESTKTAGAKDFIAYAKVGSGIYVTLCVIVLFILVHVIRIAGDYWLRLWVPRTGGFSDTVYVSVYGAFAVAFSIGAFFRGYLFTIVTTSKAVKLHDKLFEATVHAPMSFFDTTPIARILSCFSKHQMHVDDTMLDAAMQALQYFPLGLGAFVLCAVLVEWNWGPCIGILILGYGVLYISSTADLKTKSMEALTKPPIFSHLTATLEGLLSIRSYHAEARFDALNLEKIDRNHEALFAMQNVKSFQALYIDILSSLLIYFTALFLIFQKSSGQREVDSIGGLALSNALQMLVFVQWTIRQWGDVESQMSSVGQLVYYGSTKSEAPFEIPSKKPTADWPQKGMIKFNDIELKYQVFGVSVLKDVSLTIYPGEKIGIVGRTGSGKSTLLISLLRIVELTNGKITIDDIDVSGIGLHDLRNKIAIIPQEPVMFVGTIRSNLDPFNNSTDQEIWKALDAVFLGDKIRNTPSKLETAVTENGKSVSQGQRQLLCIARAVLSKAKILVLDEATASLDAQTDAMIQDAIKKNFGDLTMLTIAHRLNTIIESDRVLVMDAGRVAEFDEPVKLLQNKDGIFTSLVEQTGPSAAQKLSESATEAHDERVKNGYTFPQNSEKSDKPFNVAEIAAGKADHL